ncbi:MAG: hypothetical protein JWL58_5170 [Streptosporangiaceae bacterium]|nr:hypothetical protein [Streptosporangiaceae bacterium]
MSSVHQVTRTQRAELAEIDKLDTGPYGEGMSEDSALLVIHTLQDGEGLVFASDQSGWCRYISPAQPESSSVFLRFARAGDGITLAVREVHFAFLAGLGTRSLREVPLGRLEAVVNQPNDYGKLADRIRVTDDVVVPIPDEVFSVEGRPWWTYEIPEPPKRRAPRLKIKIPEGPHRKPDSFYEQIAERFAYLAAVSSRPAQDLAEANDVPVTTVHGWVREARRRGLLPASERIRKEQSTKGQE